VAGGFGGDGVYGCLLEESVRRSRRAEIQRLFGQLPAHQKRDRPQDRHVRRAVDTTTAQLRIPRLGLSARRRHPNPAYTGASTKSHHSGLHALHPAHAKGTGIDEHQAARGHQRHYRKDRIGHSFGYHRRRERDPERLLLPVGDRIKADRDTLRRSLQANWRDEYLFLLEQSHATYLHLQSQKELYDRQIERVLDTFNKKIPLQEVGSVDPVKKSEDPKTAPSGCEDVSCRHSWGRCDRHPGDQRDRGVGDTLGNRDRPLEVALAKPLRIVAQPLPEQQDFGREAHQFADTQRLFEIYNSRPFRPRLALFTPASLAVGAPTPPSAGAKITQSRAGIASVAKFKQPLKKKPNAAAVAFRTAANAVCRSKSWLGDYFRRMKAKGGQKYAIVAVARKLAIIYYEMVSGGKCYIPLDNLEYLSMVQRKRIARLEKLLKRLKRLKRLKTEVA